VKERCRGKGCHILRERQLTDSVASHAWKTTTFWVYRLRMGTAYIGPYLPKVGGQVMRKRRFSDARTPLQTLQLVEGATGHHVAILEFLENSGVGLRYPHRRVNIVPKRHCVIVVSIVGNLNCFFGH
jgi:hypothetical protein